MPGWVQFDRPQRCWFWLLYSCVHKCTALACYFTRYAGPPCASHGAGGWLVCYRTLATFFGE